MTPPHQNYVLYIQGILSFGYFCHNQVQLRQRCWNKLLRKSEIQSHFLPLDPSSLIFQIKLELDEIEQRVTEMIELDEENEAGSRLEDDKVMEVINVMKDDLLRVDNGR